jgi:hypothetical protein
MAEGLLARFAQKQPGRIYGGLLPFSRPDTDYMSGPEQPQQYAFSPRLDFAAGIPGDVARALDIAGRAMSGEMVTPEQANEVAMTMMGGSAFGRAPAGALSMGLMARVSPSADRWLAEAQRYRNRNSNKLVAEGIREGVIPEAQRADAVSLAAEIRQKQAERRQAQHIRDPLKVAAFSRPRRAEELKRERGILSAPIAAHWNKEFREKAVRWGKIDPAYGDNEARKATLEAIVREARKRGLKVRHTSAGRDGRASSRYVVFPNGKEVRLSDHELPETFARFEREVSGRAPRWDGEIVVDDWRTRDMDSYFSEMAEIVSEGSVR